MEKKATPLKHRQQSKLSTQGTSLFHRTKKVQLLLSILSSIALIIGGLLPFLDNILSYFYPEAMAKPFGGFPATKTAIYIFSVVFATPIILIASKYHPWWWCYISPIVSSLIQITGFIIICFGYTFNFDLTAYACYIIAGIILVPLIRKAYNYSQYIYLVDERETEILESTLKYLENEEDDD
ncbi:hypothetical protein [Chryseobacterium sp. CT-SW4]|uniref:hypothetical protein n=1 Tax=Chryseobacterium sp. SW-1 TaxID=3157343 RepID=UPI003B0118A3